MSESNGTPSLELVSVHKRFRDGARGEVHAVRGVSLRVEPREVCVVQGPSGSGKSTLVGLAAGVILPSEGEVHVQGEVFSRMRETFRASVRRRVMSVVMQGLALVPRMTVLENVALADVPDGGPDNETLQRMQTTLEALGIGSLARSRVDALSGGERQRVALARAFCRDTPLLLLDEPTAHLDEDHCGRVMELLLARMEQGASALVVTHDPRVVDRCRSRDFARLYRFVDGNLREE